jgi:penicillin amidase
MITGRMSEILGDDYVLSDKFMRSLDIKSGAESAYSKSTSEEKIFLEAYCSGYNDFIKLNAKDLPFEFGLQDIPPLKITPVDCIAIEKLWALRQSTAFWFEPVLTDIAAKLGPDKALELIPIYPQDMPIQFAENQNVNFEDFRMNPEEIDSLNIEADSTFATIKNSSLSIGAIFSDVAVKLNINPDVEGCNLWLSKKNLNAAGSGVILANDFHSGMTLPPDWYFATISCPSIRVTGTTIPGFPFAVTGRNPYISWGMTSLKVDDFDFAIAEIDSTGKYYKATGDTLKKIILKLDTIPIAKKAPHIYFKKEIEGKNILSGSIFDRYSGKPEGTRKKFSKYALICDSRIFYDAGETKALYKIAKSENVSDFQKSVSKWKSPASVFGVADIFGNFGLKAAGTATQRKGKTGLLPIPVNGADTVEMNTQMYDYSIFNNENLFSVSANNALLLDSFYTRGYSFDWPRAYRITRLLAGSDTYDVTDAKIMQNDIYSEYARKLLDICIPVWLSHDEMLTGVQKEALAAITDFNCIFSAISIEATIYTSFLERLHYNVFADELGNKLFAEYMKFPSFADAKLYELLTTDQTSAWFDNVETKEEVENAYFLIFKSFMEGVNRLVKNFESSNIYDWNYEYIHTGEPKHFLADNDLLYDTYKAETVFLGGNRTTITNSRNTSPNAFGSTMRFIADMDENQIHHIMPGGQSGNPVSPDFSNQLNFWKSSAYYTIPLKDEDFVPAGKIIVIKPE